jgi:hypothetical protein
LAGAAEQLRGSASGSLSLAGDPPLSRHGCQAPRALSQGTRLGVQRAAVGRGGPGGPDAGRAFVTVSTSSASVRCPVSGADNVHGCLSTRPVSSVRCGRLSVRVSAVRCPGEGCPVSVRSRVRCVRPGGRGEWRWAGSTAAMAGLVVARSVHDPLLDPQSRNLAIDPGAGLLGQRRRRLGLGRRCGKWLSSDQVHLVAAEEPDAREDRPRVGERGRAARWRLRCVVIVSGLGLSRLAAAGLPGWAATCACGRGAAATCSERRPLDADDALTCGVVGWR